MKHLIVMSCIVSASVGIVAASPAIVRSDAKAADAGDAFVVTSVTPARRQEVLPDLSDPGLNGRVTVRFSARVDPREVLDADDDVNGLSGEVDFRGPESAEVPGSSSVRSNVLMIDPVSNEGPLLRQGRYTLTLQSTIRSADGRLLNGGRSDHVTTFFVGSDTYAPVLLRVTPNRATARLGRRRPIVVTFDEPIAEASAAASIRLEDRSTSPATAVPARVDVTQRGHKLVVRPAARSGYPADADVTLVIQGRGSATDASTPVLTDERGNAFTRDSGSDWVADPDVPTLFQSRNGDFDDVSGEFSVTFPTRALRPAAR